MNDGTGNKIVSEKEHILFTSLFVGRSSEQKMLHLFIHWSVLIVSNVIQWFSESLDSLLSETNKEESLPTYNCILLLYH